MEFDLNKITEQGILIDTIISFDEEYLRVSEIKKLDNVHVSGRIYYSLTKEVIFAGNVNGNMTLVDGYSGDLIDYPFNINLDEILANFSDEDEKMGKKPKNSLDLKEVLWENIVLEVPIVVSKDNKVKTKKGEFWEVRDENSKKDDPRLECFRTLLDEGKE
ncbi:uncharacterized protein BN817_00857 [Mycoplasma sp. CAG:956]|nr:uncharacterized protein BN817_00857 [Mycoplasma sp. CAG:956]